MGDSGGVPLRVERAILWGPPHLGSAHAMARAWRGKRKVGCAPIPFSIPFEILLIKLAMKDSQAENALCAAQSRERR